MVFFDASVTKDVCFPSCFVRTVVFAAADEVVLAHVGILLVVFDVCCCLLMFAVQYSWCTEGDNGLGEE